MECPKCGNNDIAISTYQETKPRGCLTIVLYLLLALTLLGLLIVIPLLLRGKQSETVTTCICKKCGNKWNI